MIKIKQKGNFRKTKRFLVALKHPIDLSILNKYGSIGVEALSSATPVDSGETANSWIFEIEREANKIKLVFRNTNIQNGCPIAIILQYGHNSRNNHWIEGRDYINPAIQPIFDRLSDDIWKEAVR